MFCQTCGKKQETHANFCGYCGVKMPSADEGTSGTHTSMPTKNKKMITNAYWGLML